jgi:hypothetical protein
MLLKKFTPSIILSALLSCAILTACNDTSKSNTSTDTSTTSVQAAPADTSMQMMQDTTKMDTASTRPVSHPR